MLKLVITSVRIIKALLIAADCGSTLWAIRVFSSSFFLPSPLPPCTCLLSDRAVVLHLFDFLTELWYFARMLQLLHLNYNTHLCEVAVSTSGKTIPAMVQRVQLSV